MSYVLGIDLGTTYTAAAVSRDGRPEMITLGERAPSVPSVIYVGPGDEVLVGHAAERRALTEPERVAREFKRRFGDPTPILLGEATYSVERLSARVLRWVRDTVAQREGEGPLRTALSHPANWGPVRKELYEQVLDIAGLDQRVLIPEPVAAAVHYASMHRVAAAVTLGVYDLGGGTFDAAVVHKEKGAFHVWGQPGGIERLGGVDFDAAVIGHVVSCLGGAVEQLNPEDPVAGTALGQLQAACVQAKEALSSDVEVAIPVLLPNWHGQIRLTRSQFEQMIRPAIEDSVEALLRVIREASVDLDDLDAVLLVGGSSRIPLVSQLVKYAVPAEVAVNDPEHAIALGAARYAETTTHQKPRVSDRTVIPFPRRRGGRTDSPDEGPTGEPATRQTGTRQTGTRQTGTRQTGEATAAPTAEPDITRAIARPGIPGVVAGVLAAGILAVAILAPSFAPPDRPSAGLLRIAAKDPGQGAVRIPLGEADRFDFAVFNPPDGAERVRIDFSFLGIPLGKTTNRSLDREGSATLRANGVEVLAAGPLDGKVVLLDSNGGQVASYNIEVEPAGWGWLPAAGWLPLVLALIAFAESLLRPIRRTGRMRPSALLRMGMLGCGLGIAAVLAPWVVGFGDATIASLVVGGVLGAGAGVSVALALARRARAAVPALA